MPLTYRDRGFSGTQVDVMSGEVRIATLWKNQAGSSPGRESRPASGREQWRWTFTMSAGPGAFAVQGEADSKADAQAAILGSWERWVAAAGLLEK